MIFAGTFCLLFCAALFRSAECQYSGANGAVNGDNGDNGNGGNSGSSGSGTWGNSGSVGTGDSASGSWGNSGSVGTGDSASGSWGNSGSVGTGTGTGGSWGNSGTGFVPANKAQCLVSDIKPQSMFDMKSFGGDWYVLKRTSMSSIDPIMYALNILRDSIYFKVRTHSMRAKITSSWDKMELSGSTIRAVSLFGIINLDVCQSIPTLTLRPENPAEPGKLSLRFLLGDPLSNLLGLAGNMDMTKLVEGIFGENFFDFTIVSTDYQNYAVIYNCKSIRPNGMCGEPQVLVLGRKTTLSQYHENLVKAALRPTCVTYDFLHVEEQLSNETC